MCEPGQRQHVGRSGWYPGHPSSRWVREDSLLDILHCFFAVQIFGSRRRDLLAAQFASLAVPASEDRNAERSSQLQKAIRDIE